MAVQVKYELVNQTEHRQLFKQYLSPSSICMFKRNKTILAIGNPYIESLQILKDQIKKFNLELIRIKSGSRLAKHLQIT